MKTKKKRFYHEAHEGKKQKDKIVNTGARWNFCSTILKMNTWLNESYPGTIYP